MDQEKYERKIRLAKEASALNAKTRAAEAEKTSTLAAKGAAIDGDNDDFVYVMTQKKYKMKLAAEGKRKSPKYEPATEDTLPTTDEIAAAVSPVIKSASPTADSPGNEDKFVNTRSQDRRMAGEKRKKDISPDRQDGDRKMSHSEKNREAISSTIASNSAPAYQPRVAVINNPMSQDSEELSPPKLLYVTDAVVIKPNNVEKKKSKEDTVVCSLSKRKCIIISGICAGIIVVAGISAWGASEYIERSQMVSLSPSRLGSPLVPNAITKSPANLLQSSTPSIEATISTTTPSETLIQNPMKIPTQSTTGEPTEYPTKNPTKNPVKTPTRSPTRKITISPTRRVTVRPTGKSFSTIGFDKNIDDWLKNQSSNIENWQTSRITNMACLFNGDSGTSSRECPASVKAGKDTGTFNKNIGRWDVSGVTDISQMFRNAEAFNADITQWDVSKVTDMSYTFTRCELFNQDISEWDISSVKSLLATFKQARYFNQNLNSWNVGNVTNMKWTFQKAKRITGQPCLGWDLSGVTEKEEMMDTTPDFELC